MGSKVTKVHDELKQATLDELHDVAAKLEQRVVSIKTCVASLVVTSNAEKERSDLVAKYLEDLHGTRPKDGLEVMEGFRRLNGEVTKIS